MTKLTVKRSWYASGSPFVWLNGGALAISLVMVIGTLFWILFNGFDHFWPKKVFDANYEKRVVTIKQVNGKPVEVDGKPVEEVIVTNKRVIGQVFDVEDIEILTLKEGRLDTTGFTGETAERSRVKISKHFEKYMSEWLKDRTEDERLTVIERTINGNIYGYIHELTYYEYDRDAINPQPDFQNVAGKAATSSVPSTENDCPSVSIDQHTVEHYQAQYRKQAKKVTLTGAEALAKFNERVAHASTLRGEMIDVAKHAIGSINYDVKQLQDREKYFDYRIRKGDDPAEFMAERKSLVAKYCELTNDVKVLESKLSRLKAQLHMDTYIYEGAASKKETLPVAEVVYQYQPNTFSWTDKWGHFFHKVWEFVADDPREANSEGGVYPAIFGTVIMVILMSIVVTPIGVIAAIYMHEYAKQGTLIRIVRVAVNNLAGVPSIVFGIFGLAFFVYFIGGGLDALFYPHLSGGVWGSPGLIWASLTLALLTLPVVIVSTEEGLSRIPRAVREGSLALGSTKWETLWRVVIPMASPGIMTGLILAIARAAGEVAPLMLVGVVKSAPELVIDGNFPFFHAERQFMHLGFHIYDVGFQSPDSEAVRGNVYATSALLIVIIVSLNLFAVRIRNRLREKFRALQH